MTNISGANNLILVDSDALIGLIYEEDLLHKRCVDIFKYLQTNNLDSFIPYPIILEAATMLSRVAKRADLAAAILKEHTSSNKFDTNVESLVAKLYNPKTSNKNTPFDHYVLALAKKNNILYVFSFDSFYKKHGLFLAEDLLLVKRDNKSFE